MVNYYITYIIVSPSANYAYVEACFDLSVSGTSNTLS